MPFSAEEPVVALVLIVPGFISVNLIIHLFGTSQKFSEFEKCSWSLFFSFIIDSLFLWHHGLDTVEEMRDFGILSDKIEYFGGVTSVHYTRPEESELILGRPMIVIRDDKGDVSDKISCGEQLFIPESKIDKVVVVSHRTTRWKRFNDWYPQKTK